MAITGNFARVHVEKLIYILLLNKIHSFSGNWILVESFVWCVLSRTRMTENMGTCSPSFIFCCCCCFFWISSHIMA